MHFHKVGLGVPHINATGQVEFHVIRDIGLRQLIMSLQRQPTRICGLRHHWNHLMSHVKTNCRGMKSYAQVHGSKFCSAFALLIEPDMK